MRVKRKYSKYNIEILHHFREEILHKLKGVCLLFIIIFKTKVKFITQKKKHVEILAKFDNNVMKKNLDLFTSSIEFFTRDTTSSPITSRKDFIRCSV